MIVRDQAVLLLCCISKLNQLSFFCNFLRTTPSAEPQSGFGAAIIERQSNEIVLYRNSKGIFLIYN